MHAASHSLLINPKRQKRIFQPFKQRHIAYQISLELCTNVKDFPLAIFKASEKFPTSPIAIISCDLAKGRLRDLSSSASL